MRLLIAGQGGFVAEAQDVLRAGLTAAAWVSVDDTGARHKAANGVCTQIGNDHFAWFGSTASKNDIRCQITKRKVSGDTRSDLGRDCRDAFLGLAKTCAKLRISFWDYLGSRLTVQGC